MSCDKTVSKECFPRFGIDIRFYSDINFLSHTLRFFLNPPTRYLATAAGVLIRSQTNFERTKHRPAGSERLVSALSPDQRTECDYLLRTDRCLWNYPRTRKVYTSCHEVSSAF